MEARRLGVAGGSSFSGGVVLMSTGLVFNREGDNALFSFCLRPSAFASGFPSVGETARNWTGSSRLAKASAVYSSITKDSKQLSPHWDNSDDSFELSRFD